VAERLGILGGTFDPVHLGHLHVAETALAQLALDRVLFIPAGAPWRKTAREISPAQQRIDMLKLAIGGISAFEISTIETDREGPSYMVETLSELAKANPGADLYLILGEDALTDLPNWHEPEEILEMAVVAVAPRGGRIPRDESWRTLRGVVKRTVWLDMKPLPTSATEIRNRIRRGEPILGMMPPAVEAYVRQHGLYRKGPPRKRGRKPRIPRPADL